MRLFFFFVCCLAPLLTSAQPKVELPWNAGEIRYDYQLVFKKVKAKKIHTQLLDWVKTQEKEGFYASKPSDNIKQLEVNGLLRVPTHNRSNPISFLIDFNIRNNVLNYRIHRFHLQEIDYSLEAFFKKHEGTENTMVQKTMHYLTVGVHSRISQLSNGIQIFLQEANN
jgi:hypothetical protein